MVGKKNLGGWPSWEAPAPQTPWGAGPGTGTTTAKVQFNGQGSIYNQLRPEMIIDSHIFEPW